MHSVTRFVLGFDRQSFDVACIRAEISSQEALARRLGVSRSVIAEICRGVIPSPEMRQAIAGQLGAPEDEIWRRLAIDPERRS